MNLGTKILATDIAEKATCLVDLCRTLTAKHGITILGVNIDMIGTWGIRVHVGNGLRELAEMNETEVWYEKREGSDMFPEEMCAKINGVIYFQLCDENRPGVYMPINGGD